MVLGISFGAWESLVTNSSIIQSIQHISITIGTSSSSNTATISSVTTSNTIVFYNGCTTTDTGTGGDVLNVDVYLSLSNATTVTATRAGNSNTVTVLATIVEFVSGVLTSNQSGTISYTGTSNTATIASVDTSKAVCFYLGSSANSAGCDQYLNSATLTNATTVTARNGSGGGVAKVLSYQVVEFSSACLKSIQVLAISAGANSQVNTTISAVNTGNTMVHYNGIETARTAWDNAFFDVLLSNSTTVQINNGGNITNVNSATIRCTVIEFNNGHINVLNRGVNTITTSSNITDATIGAVTIAKSLTSYCGMTQGQDTPTDLSTKFASVLLQSTTNVRAQTNTTPVTGNVAVSWEVISFN